MLVARHTIQADRVPGGTNQRNHDTNVFVEWPANTSLPGGPEARGRMYQWWNLDSQVSPTLRTQAIHATTPANLDFATHSCNIADCVVNTRNSNEYLSMPYTGSSAVGVGQNPVFFLSEQDITQRLGQDTSASRITFRIALDGTVGAASWSWYWLRSAGAFNTTPVAQVDTNGAWNASGADGPNTTFAFRPAVWVRR